jgi:DNA-binding transcriptional regulator YhcF (GntR family)
MHRIWISRNSSIPVREQLSAQILYGILSRRLGPAERLPSVRDLARRLKVHSNTVSAAYRDLAARGWVKAKTGSGVFVREIDDGGKAYGIDAFVEAWVQEGAGRGFSADALGAVLERIRREAQEPALAQPLLVSHPDRNLARILAAEIEEAAECAVAFAGLKDAPPALETFRVLTTTTGAGPVSKLATAGHALIALKSVEELVAGLGRPAAPLLIAMVSHSESILKWASLLIPGLQHSSSEVIQRNPEQANWRDGLAACDMIAADIVAARELPENIRPVVLRLVSEAFLHSLVTPKKA